jgi:prolyl oligopeptidase
MVDSRSSKVSEVNLPFPGSLYLKPFFNVTSFSQESDKLIFALTNFSNQLTSFECNEDKVLKKNIFPVVNYMDTSFELNIEEIEVPLPGNIKVPLSIVYKKGLVLDGNNPTILEAYGAYGYSMRPYFKANLLLWLKYGGIYAIAHVRGGGEKGDNWYKGGFKSTKSNSWKDLISCSEFMIQNKYTSQNKLALTGASAGAIAVGRAITERPDLCKAAVIYNGIINPLRMETSFNNTSITEFGTVKDSLEFHYLLDMDTYHHIFEEINYPSVLFTASYNDSRVAPWLSAKGVAKMQQNCKTENIILYRIEDNGHFGYPSDADVYSFLFWQLNHPNFKYQGRNNN